MLTVSPERIGAMTAAALVILHTEHHRTGWHSVTITTLLGMAH